MQMASSSSPLPPLLHHWLFSQSTNSFFFNFCFTGAAYFAQELLSTFPTLGEVSLHPTTGGVFTIHILDKEGGEGRRIWDRKEDGGFPDVKILKRTVRDIVEPERGLGHVDGVKASVMEKGEGGQGDAGSGCAECAPAEGAEHTGK